MVIKDADGKKRTCEFEKQSKWANYQVGMDVTLKVNIGGDPDCATLKPAN